MKGDYDGAGNLLRRYVHGPGVDEYLVMYTGSGTANRSYYHANHQGSIIAMSDGSGNVTEQHSYDSYGNSDELTGNPFRYTGRRLDAETGLYYYRARYYSPAIGRFLQTDPIGYGDGLNWYAYVHNDPVNGNDPLGLEVQCDTDEDGKPINCREDNADGIEEIVVTATQIEKPELLTEPQVRRSKPKTPEQEEACEELKPNGCGAKDDWKSNFIPNKPGNFDFTKACNNHDTNFGTVDFGFEKANDQFLADMLAVPDQQIYVFSKTGTGARSETITSESWAKTYFNAVSGEAGRKAYNAAQKLAKVCKGGK